MYILEASCLESKGKVYMRYLVLIRSFVPHMYALFILPEMAENFVY